MRFSLPEFLSDLSADATTISLDMPNGGYDRLHKVIERQVKLPQNTAGRLAVIAVTLAASRLAKQQLGPLGPVANFINEIGEDTVREEAKRILEATGRTTPDIVVASTQTTRSGVLDRIAIGLFPWLKER